MECRRCREPIAPGTRTLVFEGKAADQHYHLLCAAIDPPDPPDELRHFRDLTERQRSLANTLSKLLDAAIANGREVRLVWDRREFLRGLFAIGDHCVLFHDSLPKPIDGTLRETIASVPDDDFESAAAALARYEAERPAPIRFEYHDRRTRG